ncbi:DMT family transporter [Chitinolyticbacter meiyuanensis]|uniref:DMT family transporter n=1 Tax=Chitinolyticbacter meiyuanensis TaxID=682798 RepID=UPI0011E60765|nr:EamA family transporter [Chitinolyticbacter meiyuanensis]
MNRPLSSLPWLADLMLLLVAVVWGTSYGVAKSALAFYPVLGFLAVRFCLTFVLLLPTLRELAAERGQQALKAGLPLGLILLCIFLCETFGVALTSASNAAFLISLTVVLTPFVEWLLLRRRPDSQAFVVAGISLIGAWLLTASVEFGRFNIGDGLMLAAALLRALMVSATQRLTAGKTMSMLTLTAIQSGVVGSGSLIVATLMLPHGLPALPHQPAFWIATIYLVLFCTIFAFFAQNYGVRHTGSPSRVSLLMGSEPVFGALFAAFWLGERLAPEAWLGGALIVGAALWASWPRSVLRPAAIG